MVEIISHLPTPGSKAIFEAWTAKAKEGIAKNIHDQVRAEIA